MGRFAQGFAAAYLLAAVYFCGILSMTGAITPPGAAPIAALMWPVSFAHAFWFVSKKDQRR